MSRLRYCEYMQNQKLLKKAVYAKAPKPVLWRVGDKSLKKTCFLIRVELQGFCEGRFQDVLLPPHYFIF